MEEDESSHTELLEEDIPATIPLEDPNEDSGDGTTLTLNPNLALVERLHAQVRQNARDLLQRKIQMRRELTDGDRLALEHCRLFPNPESINVSTTFKTIQLEMLPSTAQGFLLNSMFDR